MPDVYLYTGQPGTGKTTRAKALQLELQCPWFDGDVVRQGLSSDLQYTNEDRFESIRRIFEATKILHNQGFSVVISAVAPIKASRELFSDYFGKDYYEIKLEKVYEQRPKDYYCKYET